MSCLFLEYSNYYLNLIKNINEFSLDFSIVISVILKFKNPSFIFIIRCIRRYQSKLIFELMANNEENRGTIGDNHLRDGDYGMQVIWDQLDRHSVMIAALEEKQQIEFGDINTRFDGLTFRLEALGLHANVNQERREALTENDTRGTCP
jgi:hypothetical protein